MKRLCIFIIMIVTVVNVYCSDKQKLQAFQKCESVDRPVTQDIAYYWSIMRDKKRSYYMPDRGVSVIQVKQAITDRYKFVQARMHNNTAVVVDAIMQDGTRKLLTATFAHSELDDNKTLDHLIKPLERVSKGQAIIVGVNGDEFNCLRERDSVWLEQLRTLQKLGINVHFVPYKMVPGAEFRDRNHFVVHVEHDRMVGEIASRGVIKEFEISR